MSVTGVQNEDRHAYTREESRYVRARSLRLLGSLIRPHRGRLLLAVVVVLVSTAAQVAGPWLISLGLDQGMPAMMSQNAVPLLLIGGGYLAAAVVGGVLIAWYIRLSARISQGVLLSLRTRLFRHTQRLSLDFHEKYTSGRIISRQTSDLEAIRQLLDGGLNELVTGLLFMLFTIVAMLVVDPISTLFVLVSLIPLGIAVRWFQLRSQRVFRRSRVMSARLISFFVETMTGIRAVKAYRVEQRNEQRYGEHVENYRAVTADSVRVYGVFEPILVFIGSTTVALLLLNGAFRVLDGTMSTGVLLAVLLYARNFYGPMHELAMFYNSYQAAAAALEKISGVLEEEPSIEEPAEPVQLDSPRGEVHFDAVAFGYADGPTVLPELELTLPAGQVVAVVGRTGAGKSTIAKLLARFYDPSQGAVRLDGVDLRRLSTAQLRSTIVMVSQESYLFSGTIADNILLGRPEASMDEVEQAARAVGVHEFVSQLPAGYRTEVHKRGSRLSAGQRQLISFARAFLADPSVLILDEATALLDMPSERQVQHGLQTLLAGRTAMIIAHRLSTVSIADRVLVMEHGRVIEDGSPEELIAGSGRFASMHEAWRDSLA